VERTAAGLPKRRDLHALKAAQAEVLITLDDGPLSDQEDGRKPAQAFQKSQQLAVGRLYLRRITVPE
jgi:hypothetical protein